MSALARELASHASVDNPAGTFVATVLVDVHEGLSGPIGEAIRGYGITRETALANLAAKLDAWAAAHR